MNKNILAFILLFAFANCDVLRTIFLAKHGQCDKDGNGFLEVDFTSKIVIPTKIQFNITLTGEGGDIITAMCWAEGKGYSEYTAMTDSGLLESDLDSTYNDGRLRRLQTDDGVYYAGCHFSSPEEGGKYTVGVPEGSEFEVPNTLTVALLKCLSADAARGRMNIALSFRQVNKFNLATFSFWFYAFTRANIPKGSTITFYLWALKGGARLKKIPATCTLDGGNDITVSDSSPIAAAPFSCSFADQVSGIQLDDIQLISSDGVAGLPSDLNYLRPSWIDLQIKLGKLKDAATMTNIPIFHKISANSLSFASDYSFFTWTIDFKQTDLDIKVGNFFKFPLAFPTGTMIKCVIESIAGGKMVLKFLIQGKIDNSPLIWEQTVISFNGIEVMVLPAHETESITTEGVPEDPETTDEPEMPPGSEYLLSDLSDQVFSDVPAAFKEEPISYEDALKRAELPLSFRQISEFKPNGEEITFNFFALTTKDLKVDGNYSSVIIIIQLIGADGVEETTEEANCTLEKDVTLGDNKLVQANYKCKIEGISSAGNYTSLRVNKTDDVAGIPSDELLLNPAMTDKAIADNELKNCAEDNSIPPVFTVESIDDSQAESDGIFIIKGSFDGEPNVNTKLTFPLTYPEGTSLLCKVERDELKCKPDQEVYGPIVMEQTIMAEGANELFILGSFNKNMTCENGVFKEAEKKKDVEISFRQVSHIESITNGLTFFFAAWANKNLPAGETIEMTVVLDEGEKKVEKNATCVLKEAVTTSDEAVQGDFQCTVTLEEGEEASPENLTVSTTNNNEIGGCAELSPEEASPNATDAAISESAELNNSLAITYDLSLEENKNNGNITPPTFSITAVDTTVCSSKGKIKLTGTFDQDITEEITFEIPLSFPMTDIKCTVENAIANNEVEITCKIKKVKKFSKFRKFVFEPRMIKNKRKEMLFIKGNILDGGSDEEMLYSFDELKVEKMKKKKKAPVSFLQFGPPPLPDFLFFMALMKLPTFTSFPTTTFEVSLIREGSTLRLLSEEETEGNIDCEVNNTTSGNVALLNCKDKSGNNAEVSKIDLSDPNVAGTPDTAPVEKNPAYDYSKNTSVNVPKVSITSIEKDTCTTTGQYKIIGTADPSLTAGSGITIPFSSPDSSGLCTVTVSSGTTVTMTCQNMQKFNAPKEMIILPQMIYGDDDTTPYFQIINSYTQPIPFSCIISDKSLKNDVGNLSPSNSSGFSDSDTSSGSKLFHSKSSSGLSGGAIAGIVIACVAVVAIVGAIIALSSKGIFSKGAAATHAEGDNTSSLNKFTINNQNMNIV